jgi:hypothetical protein
MFYRTQRKYIFKSILKKGEDSLHDFCQKSRNEIHETEQAEKIFVKYVERKEVTIEEKKILKNQTFDMVKIIFIGVPLAIIPGFSVVMIFIVKVGRKYNFNVLPSSFAPQKKDDQIGEKS